MRNFVVILVFMLLCATVVSAITSVTKSAGAGTQNIMYINGLYDDNGITAFFGHGCSANEYVSAIDATGTFTCIADTWDISGVTAGAGLINGGSSGDVTLDVGAGTCVDANANDVQVEANCITGTQLADAIALDANLAVTGYNVSIDSPTFFVDASNNRVGVGIATPAVTFDVDSNSNSQSMRLRGADGATQIGDMMIGSSGEFILTTAASTDSYPHFDFRSENGDYGIVIRESDGTGTGVFANLYVMDAAADYLNMVIKTTVDTPGLVVTSEEYVGIGTATPGGEFEIYNPASTSGADDEFRISSNVTGVGASNGFSMAFAIGGTGMYMTNEGDIMIKAGDATTAGIREGGYSRSNPLAVFTTDYITLAKNVSMGASAAASSIPLTLEESDSTILALFENTYTTNNDGIGIRLDDASLTSTNDFIQFVNGSGTIIGDIDANGTGTVFYRGFRGSHYADYDSSDRLETGMVVVSINEISPNTPNMPKVDVTDKKNDKRAYGVWNGFEEEYMGVGTEGKVGTVSAVGDGEILVTDLGGDLKVGSLLTTSGRKGFAQRQDDDLIHSYTLAKARLDVDWDDVEIDPNFGFKTARIPCTLLAG